MTEQEILREAYRIVLAPQPNDRAATDVDRARVLNDLRTFCYFDIPFDVAVTGDIAMQLAGREGRRTVFLRILSAIQPNQKPREELSREGVTE